MNDNDEIPTKQQAINLRALRWAYEQDDLSVTMKAVLMTFALHSDERGYSWPGVDHIASTWGLDATTVRRAIKALFVRRKLCRTKKRRGSTGQVKVYRLPKITWASRARCTPLETIKTGPKAGERRAKGGRSARRIMNDEQTINHHSTSRDNSIPSALAERIPESEKFGKDYQHHADAPAQSHMKWPEFAEYCRSKGGTPSENGFWSWLCQQKPQWRNKVRQKLSGEEGWVLNGKFFTREQASQMGIENSDLLTQFRQAKKRNGKIEIIPP